MRFKFYHQHYSSDCGPACLRMIAHHYGKKFRISTLRELCHITRDGVSLLGISDAAESIGFRTMGVSLTFDELACQVPLPCIVHWRHRHFVVVYRIRKIRDSWKIFLADPAHGSLKYSKDDFLEAWLTPGETENKGICLLLEPTSAFESSDPGQVNRFHFRFLLPYLKPHQISMILLFAGMIGGSIIQLLFPFLTQAIVDKGIRYKDIHFITLILAGQMALFIGMISSEFVRGWILLKVSTRINIHLISDFLLKIMRLPIGFFSTTVTGDLMQRINDHQRIQSFLTISSLNLLFAVTSFLMFGLILLFYNYIVFLVFLAGSILYALWIYLFMGRRRDLDFMKFSKMAENQENLIQLITGMQEIKLHHCEQKKRKEWEQIQDQLFKISLSSLKLSQYQNVGAFFFVRTKDILITFLTAYFVIRGDLTLGMMLAIQYILGQMNSPVEQMVSFIREDKDAAFSLERLDEIRGLREEDSPDDPKLTGIEATGPITLSDVSFQYEGPHSPLVLNHVNLIIPERKVTAIVGSSGSGKTTLIKMILGFYPPVSGDIKIGDIPMERISPQYWRSLCGTVMQDGYIFSDTLAGNIAMSEDQPDPAKLEQAIRIANLVEFLEDLPLGLDTKVGMDGTGLSQGQRQRILIARAVYRNPEILFFDEATNSLDAKNEKIILDHLNSFFKGKTVIIVAHRLSTVKNAHQIVVLDRGRIVETGNHETLTHHKGAYFELVRNQLELGY